MTPEEVKRKLKEAGIPVGEPWTQTEDKTVRSPIVERQKENLRKLEGLLEKQIEADMERQSKLAAALVKLKHGGGS